MHPGLKFLTFSPLSAILFLFLVKSCLSANCSLVTVVIDTKKWADEISFQIHPQTQVFSGFKDFSQKKFNFCLLSYTTFTFIAKDSFGDGWNGGDLK